MRVTVSLTKDEYERLGELARAERRPLRDQAAVLIAHGLNLKDRREEHRPTAIAAVAQ